MTIALEVSDVGWRSITMTSTDSTHFPLLGSFWDYSDNELIDDNKYVISNHRHFEYVLIKAICIMHCPAAGSIHVLTYKAC